jgi:hypothetical protein
MIKLSKYQGASYVHVDDGVFLTGDGEDANPICDQVMSEAAEFLDALGLSTPERRTNAEVEKIIGYKIIRKPAAITIPDDKLALLHQALRDIVSKSVVDTGVLHSLLSLWVWGAILRRELLAIPSVVFRFLDRHPKQKVIWWPKARCEVACIAKLLPLMLCELHLPAAPLLFATDAMGSEEGSADCGGFGVVACQPSAEMVRKTVELGAHPGWTVARLDGDVSKLKDPKRELSKSQPFSRLPASLTDGSTQWFPVDSGRWKWHDHITLGEARASIKLLARLAAIGSAHCHVVVDIIDSQAWGGERR